MAIRPYRFAVLVQHLSKVLKDRGLNKTEYFVFSRGAVHPYKQSIEVI